MSWRINNDSIQFTRTFGFLPILFICCSIGEAQASDSGHLPAITSSLVSQAGRDIALDPQGNVYWVGTASSTSLPVTPGAPYPTIPGARSYLAKIDTQGRLVYSTYVPGSDPAIAVNSAGEVFTATETIESVTSCNRYIVVTQFDSTGTRVLSTSRFGGCTGLLNVSAIALDAQENVYITGVTVYPQFPTTPGALRTTFKGPVASYLLKFNPRTSQILYSTFLGQSVGERVGVRIPFSSSSGSGGLSVDSNGSAYVAGFTNDSDFPLSSNALDRTDVGDYVAKINTTGSGVIFGTFLGSRSDAAVAIDDSGAIYVGAGGFVRKVNTEGRVVYSTRFDAGVTTIAVDSSGNAIVGGYQFGSFPPGLLGPVLHPLMAGSADGTNCLAVGPQHDPCSVGYLAKYDPDGNLLWSSFLGVPGLAYLSSVAVGPDGNPYVAGSVLPGTSLPGMQLPSVPLPQYYLAKIEPVGPPPLVSYSGVVSAASFQHGIAPGGLATLFGANLSDADGVVVANSNPLPTELAGTSVSFNGKPAALLAAAKLNGAEQINLQVPFDADFSGAITIRRGRALGFVSTLGLPNRAPGIFTLPDGTPAVLHGEDYRLVTKSNPAHAGETILIYATGLGAVNPPVATGVPAPLFPLSTTTRASGVRIAGTAAGVLFSGLAPGFAGLYQLNVIVPNVPSGDADLYIYLPQPIDSSESLTLTSQHVSIPIQ